MNNSSGNCHDNNHKNDDDTDARHTRNILKLRFHLI